MNRRGFLKILAAVGLVPTVALRPKPGPYATASLAAGLLDRQQRRVPVLMINDALRRKYGLQLGHNRELEWPEIDRILEEYPENLLGWEEPGGGIEWLKT